MVERGGAGADRPDIEVPGFELHRVIGRGGFATVYEAYQPALDRPVAMKVLSRLEGRALELFQRECRAAGRLGWHDHIVDVFDTGSVPDGRPYLVMEHLEQGSLADRIGSGAPMPWETMPWAHVLGVGAQLASALAAAHAAGTLHRDVKPANVLQDGDRVKLGDFGIAGVRSAQTDDRAGTGYQFLSLGYASPEAYDRSDVVDERSDLYSLGATLYTLLAGRLLTGRSVDLRELHVPDDLVAIVEALTEPRAADRPASAREAGDALGACQARAGLPVDRVVVSRPGARPTAPATAAPPPPADLTVPVAVGRAAPVRPDRGVQPARTAPGRGGRPRRRLRLAIGAIVVVAVAATVLAVVLSALRPESPPPGGVLAPVIDEPEPGATVAVGPVTVEFTLPTGTRSYEVFLDRSPVAAGDGTIERFVVDLDAGPHELIVRATGADGVSRESGTVEVTAR